MRPPKCVICGKKSKSHSSGFKLVSFKLTKEQQEHNNRMKSENRVGHPRGKDWFCDFHYPRAKQLKQLSNIEAIELIKLEMTQTTLFMKINNWLGLTRKLPNQ